MVPSLSRWYHCKQVASAEIAEAGLKAPLLFLLELASQKGVTSALDADTGTGAVSRVNGGIVG